MPMVLKSIATRCFFLHKSKSPSLPLFTRRFSHSSTPLPPPPSSLSAAKIPLTRLTPHPLFNLIGRTFCTSSETPPSNKRNPKLVNFSLPSDSDSDSDTAPPESAIKSKLPPPYNPFNNKPAIEEPDDPKNLQEVFAKIRKDGLMNSAVKMFDGLSQDGLTHEALELFSQIKDKGQMPDVVAHTAVMEAYANAGQAKDAHKVYLRMLSSGVLPNAYTYRVLIRVLAESGDVKMAKEAKKYVWEMVVKGGMRPNAGICVAAFEGMVNVGLEDEGIEMLEMLKEEGVVPEENKAREVLKNKRGTIYRTVMSVLYGK